MGVILDLVQGSQEWLDMKFTHFGSSYAPVIMGASSHTTPYQLWHSMLFRTKKDSNKAMERGKHLEPLARVRYERKHGVSLITPVVQSRENNAWIASLDGCTFVPGVGFKHAIEIKAYGKDKHEKSLKNGVIPQDAQWQMLHTMMVLDMQEMTYISFNPEFGSDEYVEIPFYRQRDDEMLYRQKLADFVSCVANYKEPPHGPKDFYDASNNERWGELETEYCFLKAYIETLQEQSDSLREQLIEEANSMSVQGKKLRLTQIHNKGRIHYDMIPELKTMDLEKYRGTSYITYKISEV